MKSRLCYAVVLLACGLFIYLQPCFADNHPPVIEAKGFDINLATAERADSFMFLPSRGLVDPIYEDSSR